MALCSAVGKCLGRVNGRERGKTRSGSPATPAILAATRRWRVVSRAINAKHGHLWSDLAVGVILLTAGLASAGLGALLSGLWVTSRLVKWLQRSLP